MEFVTNSLMILNNKSDVDIALKNLALGHPYAPQQYSHVQPPPRVKVPNEAIGKDEKSTSILTEEDIIVTKKKTIHARNTDMVS